MIEYNELDPRNLEADELLYEFLTRNQ